MLFKHILLRSEPQEPSCGLQPPAPRLLALPGPRGPVPRLSRGSPGAAHKRRRSRRAALRGIGPRGAQQAALLPGPKGAPAVPRRVFSGS